MSQNVRGEPLEARRVLSPTELTSMNDFQDIALFASDTAAHLDLADVLADVVRELRTHGREDLADLFAAAIRKRRTRQLAILIEELASWKTRGLDPWTRRRQNILTLAELVFGLVADPALGGS